MSVPKLILTVDTFGKEEWTSFRKYILMRSSEESDTYSLFKLLQKRKYSSQKEFDFDGIHKRHFIKLSAKGFQNLMSRLFLFLEDWLVGYELHKNPHEKSLLLIKAYNDRGLYNNADKVARKLETELNENQLFDETISAKKTRLLHYQYYSDNPIKYREGGMLLERLVENHLFQFKEQSSIYLLELHNWGKLQSYDYSNQIEIIQTIHTLLSASEFTEVLNILQKVVTTEDYQQLKEMKDLLFNNRFDADTEIHRISTLYMIETARKMSIKGLLPDDQFIVSLFDYAFKTQVFFKNGKIPRLRFHNIISVLGATTNSFVDTTRFINKWVDQVDTQNIESTRALALAQNCFYGKKYALIRDHLIGFDFPFGHDKFRAIRLELIGLYYDRNEDYELINLKFLSASRFFHRNRKKLSSKIYESNNNFIYILKKMIARDFKKIHIDIPKMQFINNRQWLETEIRKAEQKPRF